MTALVNSLLIALFSTVFACVLGALAAFSLVAVSPRRRVAVSLLTLCVLPILVPNYVIVSFWMEALGTHGWLARLLNDGAAISLTGLWPTILVLSLIYWSPVALICWFTLGRINRAMIEAAELALGKRRAAVRVIAPMLWPSVAISAALVFVLTFSNFSVPAIFLVKTIQNEIYIQFVTNFEVGRALVFAMPQVFAALVMLGLVTWVLRNRPWFAVTGRSSGVAALVPSTDSERGSRFAEARLHRLAAFLFLVPLFALSTIAPLTRAISSVFQANVLWQTLIVSKTQIWNSFLFSALTATIVVALALAGMNVGGASVRRPFGIAGRVGALRRLPHSLRPSSVLDILLLFPFVLPEVLIGIALIAIFNRPSLQFIYTSTAIVLIALTIRYFIVGRLALSTGQRHIDPSLFEAAQLAGLSRWQMAQRIRLPLLAPWLFAGWWLTYLFCLADVGSLVLIQPPGCDTVPIRIFNLLHYGYDAQVSALCLVMLVLGGLPLVWSAVARHRLPPRGLTRGIFSRSRFIIPFLVVVLLCPAGLDLFAGDTGRALSNASSRPNDWCGVRRTPIEVAVLGGDIDKVRDLIKEDPSLANFKNTEEVSVLETAVTIGNDGVVKLLLDSGSDPNRRLKLHVILSGKKRTEPLTTSILHMAIQKCKTSGKGQKVVRTLVEGGADVNAPGAGGESPIWAASYWGQMDLVELLIKHGAKMNTPDANGSSPLHVALEKRHVDIAAILISKGADVNLRDRHDNTPLHIAARSNNEQLVTPLLKKGADVNAKNHDGNTPLKYAHTGVRGSKASTPFEAMKILREHGGHE